MEIVETETFVQFKTTEMLPNNLDFIALAIQGINANSYLVEYISLDDGVTNSHLYQLRDDLIKFLEWVKFKGENLIITVEKWG